MAHPTFWEVEGLCSDGEWRGIYQANTEESGRMNLAFAIEHGDDYLHDIWEDFRLVPPTAPKRKVEPLPTTVQPAPRGRRMKRGTVRREKARRRRPPVCQIPACGCTGEAHP